MSARAETGSGKVEGRQEQGLHVFLGIPYARPPVGPLRFRPPQPPETWSGTRPCTAFGPSAPQVPMMLPLPGMDVGPQSEDCLYLNVYTPAPDGARRPVMVWIHGGAFVIGSGSQPIYDGSHLARRGDAVVVTINYRLGPLGFLHLADLVPDLEGATGNAGIRDQVAALEWVRDNIEAFGGDPENVTIFGESAGGMSVGTLLGTPAARGLFARAIPQSGASHNVHTRESATRVAAATLECLGLTPETAAGALREIPAEKLVEGQTQIVFRLGGAETLLPFQPLVDGEELPQPPIEAVRAGHARGVSLLTGTTRDEWRLFAMMDAEIPTLSEARLVEKIAQRLASAGVGAGSGAGANAGTPLPGAAVAAARDFVETYRRARAGHAPTDPPSLYYAFETDRVFRIPALRLAEAQATHGDRVFLYRFDWASPAFGGLLGACHAIELPFVFGVHRNAGYDAFVGRGPEVDRLAERTMDAWLAFARYGDPGHDALPPWPSFDRRRRATLILDPEPKLESDPGGDERRLWEEIL